LNSIIAPNIRNSQQDNLGSLFAFDPIQSTFLSMFNNNEQTSVTINNNNNQSNLLQRSSVIISIQDIHKLLIFLKQLSKELPADSDELKWLKSIIPNDYLNQILEQTVNNLNSTKQMNLTLTRRQSEQNLISLYNSESTEVINYLLKEPDLLEDYQILVLNINDKSLECPGMLNEDKIIKEYELNKKQQLHTNNNNNNLDSSFEPNSLNKIPSFGIMINDQDDISEACETNDRSLSSSDDHDDDDDDEDVERINNRVKDNNDDRGDGLSDFDNFSGRDTPIISGRDTSSSHSHEDLHNISSSNNMVTNNINNNSSSNNFNQNRQNNLNQRLNNTNNNTNQTNLNNGINNNNRGPNILPVTVQKTNREDINDKFCKFEISKSK
jgi:hypothetical protein